MLVWPFATELKVVLMSSTGHIFGGIYVCSARYYSGVSLV